VRSLTPSLVRMFDTWFLTPDKRAALLSLLLVPVFEVSVRVDSGTVTLILTTLISCDSFIVTVPVSRLPEIDVPFPREDQCETATGLDEQILTQSVLDLRLSSVRWNPVRAMAMARDQGTRRWACVL
jgi:hypothetical protein